MSALNDVTYHKGKIDGYLTASYNQLNYVFGPPIYGGESDKTNDRWEIDGVEIFDYKQYSFCRESEEECYNCDCIFCSGSEYMRKVPSYEVIEYLIEGDKETVLELVKKFDYEIINYYNDERIQENDRRLREYNINKYYINWDCCVVKKLMEYVRDGRTTKKAVLQKLEDDYTYLPYTEVLECIDLNKIMDRVEEEDEYDE